MCLNSPQFEVFKNEPCGPSSPKNCQNGTRSGSHPNSSSQKAPMHNSLVQITTLKFTFCYFQEKISFTFKTLRSFFKVFLIFILSLYSPRNFHANSCHGESPDTPTPPLSPENFPPPENPPFSINGNGNHSTWGRPEFTSERNFNSLPTRDSPYDRTRDRPYDPIRSRDLITRKSRDETFDQSENYNRTVKTRVKLERIDDNQFDPGSQLFLIFFRIFFNA